MPKYIFLDTWALSNYTKDDYARRFARFIKSNGYTVMFNGISMIELYNPGWEKGGIEERCARIVRFLGDHHCVVVRPEEVWQSEARIFPRQLDSLPVRLDLEVLPSSERATAMLFVLRRDQALLGAGIDIVQWKSQYDTLKAQWLADVQKIIEKGVEQGTITRTADGHYEAVSSEKREEFLRSLDWRLTDNSPCDSWQDTSVMRSRRFSTLCFWYHYINPLPGKLPKKSPSDIADIFQLSLVPYCDVFTVDTKIISTVEQALKEFPCSCQILTRDELEVKLLAQS